ncbi:MAG: hypothetical protein ACLQJL_18335 [Roseiarcus sp.]
MTNDDRPATGATNASKLDAILRRERLKNAALVGLALLAVGGLALGGLYGRSLSQAANWGFGPEWRCSLPGKGGPICVKYPARTGD